MKRLTRWPEHLCLIAYTVLACWQAWLHTIWADEAQAWLIARESGFAELFLTRLHYEGTPGLWHLLLWMLAHAHFPCVAMSVLAVCLGAASTALILYASPFPRFVRLLLPFTFGYFFLTAIVARSYSLVPLLVFSLCMAFTAKRPRPVLFALLAGLLANCALIAAVLSAGFVVLFAHAKLSVCTRTAKLSAALLLALLWAAAFYTATPAPDVTFGSGGELNRHPAVSRLLSTITGIPQPAESQTVPTPAVSGQASRQLPGRPANSAPSPKGIVALFLALFLLINASFYSVSAFWIVSFVFFCVLFLWIWKYGNSSLLLLPLSAICLASFLEFSDHHISVPLAALTAMFWLQWKQLRHTFGAFKLDRVLAVLVLLAVFEQVSWTGSAILSLRSTPFDASQDAAGFIAALPAGSRIDGYHPQISAVGAHFFRPVFSNLPHGYWPWRFQNNPDYAGRLETDLASRPEYILISGSSVGNANIINEISHILPVGTPSEDESVDGRVLQSGYRPIRRFCGKQPAHFGYAVQVCYTLYRATPQDGATQ